MALVGQIIGILTGRQKNIYSNWGSRPVVRDFGAPKPVLQEGGDDRLGVTVD